MKNKIKKQISTIIQTQNANESNILSDEKQIVKNIMNCLNPLFNELEELRRYKELASSPSIVKNGW